ncbi:MAG: quinone-interacting membrane-bound oxidoreductase complex subunit QmoC [Nitrospirae bacterium]|nr:quinone-interacting membrane-bound oxidoreductase complex subunit QmoC [Nitrospirota bacterium]
MSEQTVTEVISPDLNFVKEIIGSGGESLKKCYQCSTCTVVCSITPDDKPFPRKEMIYAQWGMKDKLISNPDIWLCHQCSDCSAYCPRGAKPGEVLGAIRKMAIKHYSAPSFLATMVGSPKYLLLLLAIPIIIFLAFVAKNGNLGQEIQRGEDGGIVYSKFIHVFPDIDVTFMLAALFAAVSFTVGIKKYWADMSKNYGTNQNGSILSSIINTITEFLAHKKFKKCEVTKGRATSHFLIFYAFAGLAITTALSIVYLYGHKFFGIQPFLFFNFGESPYPLNDPLKILGNFSALALLIGITLVILNRMKNKEKADIGGYYDWLFISVVFAIMATGILAELLRLANIASLAYPIYFAHLVFVFFLFAYAPFSKMAHMVYRMTALVFARHAGRDKTD